MTITVATSIARVITRAGKDWRCWAEDWPDAATCERAMDSLLETARTQPRLANLMEDKTLDALANNIMVHLGVPHDATFGCALIAEPIDDQGVICRDGLPQDAGAGET